VDKPDNSHRKVVYPVFKFLFYLPFSHILAILMFLICVFDF